MSQHDQTRRTFLQTSAAAAMTAPYFFSGNQVLADDAKAESKNDRPVLGCIGTGSRWGGVGPNAMRFADCVAVCDVDASHLAKAANRVKQIQGREPETGSAGAVFTSRFLWLNTPACPGAAGPFSASDALAITVKP